MKKTFEAGLVILGCVTVLRAHDMFLKLGPLFLKPHSQAMSSLYNGTFDKGENAITRDRMSDARIVGPQGEIMHPDTSPWRLDGTITQLNLKTGGEGTYVIGVSTKARVIALAAKDFNDYLEHDGVLGVLATRKEKSELGMANRSPISSFTRVMPATTNTTPRVNTPNR